MLPQAVRPKATVWLEGLANIFTGEPSRYMICFPFKSFSLEKKIYLPAMRISLLGDSINVKHYLTLPKIVTINAS